MTPHERLLSEGTVRLALNRLGNSVVSIKQTYITGKAPDKMLPDSIIINTTDHRLWLSDSEGNPVEYKLVPVQEQDDGMFNTSHNPCS
jgi:hypothetical protein